MNRYHKSVVPKARKIKEWKQWSSTIKEFKEQALLLSDEIGVKKAAGNQLLHDCWQDEGEKPKSEGSEERIGQNAVERARVCHAARNTEAEKSKWNTQRHSRFSCRRPEEVSTQGLFSYILENAKESVRPVVSMCKTLRNSFLQVEAEPYKDETLATSSGRNTHRMQKTKIEG